MIQNHTHQQLCVQTIFIFPCELFNIYITNLVCLCSFSVFIRIQSLTQFDSERRTNLELILFHVDPQISEFLPKAGAYAPLTSILNEQLSLEGLLSRSLLCNVYTSTQLLLFFLIFNSLVFIFPGLIPILFPCPLVFQILGGGWVVYEYSLSHTSNSFCFEYFGYRVSFLPGLICTAFLLL